jgi:hypothetical protein
MTNADEGRDNDEMVLADGSPGARELFSILDQYANW